MQREKLYNLHNKAYYSSFQKKAEFSAINFRTVEIRTLEIRLFILAGNSVS